MEQISNYYKKRREKRKALYPWLLIFISKEGGGVIREGIWGETAKTEGHLSSGMETNYSRSFL